MNRILIIFLASALCLFGEKSFSQMVSGPVEGELYINCDWYMDEFGWYHYGLFYSTDNGQTLALNYSYTNPPQGNYHLGLIESDAQSGTLYNLPFFNSQFLISYDHGMSWTPINNGVGGGDFTSSCVPGEIYHFGFSSDGIIERSVDYGQTFDSVRDGVKFTLEAGNSPGTVYGRTFDPLSMFPYSVLVSYDSCLTFPDTMILDTAITGDMHPELYRGANAGELYLVSFYWFPDNHFRIFFSEDYGSNWELRYISDPYSFSMVGTSFTGGREDGSFYVMMGENDQTLTYTVLTIMYSNDTAKTFTTYIHDLTATMGISQPSDDKNIKGELEIFPNPSNTNVNIKFATQGPRNSNIHSIQIRNSTGIIVEVIELLPYQGEVQLDVSQLTPGVYIAALYESEKIIATNKFIISRQ